MTTHATTRTVLLSATMAALAFSGASHAVDGNHRPVNGTIWVANRGTHTIRGFEAATGAVVRTVAMAPNSQPGDLAFAKGKVYVAEEFGTPPAIAIVDPEAGTVMTRFLLPPGSRPHHVHASQGGNLVAVGLYGTDSVAVIDTHDDVLLGPWRIGPSPDDPLAISPRVHAGVFSTNERTLYLASDASNEVIAIEARTGTVLWRLRVPGAHELALTHDEKRAYVTRRTANRLAIIDLETHATFQDIVALALPDTLRLSANERLLTVGLRTTPAQLAVVDTSTFHHALVNLGMPGELTTVAAHQWTSPSGRYTFAAFEGGTSPGVAVVDHQDGNRVVQRLGYSGRPHGMDQGK